MNELDEFRAIGIFLGLTYCCVANLCNGELIVILNREGERLTPSVVAYEGSSNVVGSHAVDKLSTEPHNVIYDVASFIGKDYNEFLADKISKFPFKIVKSKNAKMQKIYTKDSIRFVVDREGKPYQYSPVEICGHILSYLKTCAEEKLGHEITSAVITVPEEFNDEQRNKTKDAAIVAGFTNIELLKEPLAAALAYANKKSKYMPVKDDTCIENTLVIHLGSNKLEVSNIDIEIYSKQRVAFSDLISHTSEDIFGSNCFDDVLYKYFEDIWKSKGIDGEINEAQKRSLRLACQRAKRDLLTHPVAKIGIEYFVPGYHFKCEITRDKYEHLCRNLFQRFTYIIKTALYNCADIFATLNIAPIENIEDPAVRLVIQEQKSKIQKVLLVGETLKDPTLMSILSSEFGTNKVSWEVYDDGVFAMGAAYQAAMLEKTAFDNHSETSFLPRETTFDISMKKYDGTFTTLIPKYSYVPIQNTQIFTTNHDNQTEMNIEIRKDHEIVTKLTLSGIAPAPHGVPRIEVTITIDSSLNMNVKAMDKSTLKVEEKTIILKNEKTNLHLEEMVASTKKFKDQDMQRQQMLKSLYECELKFHTAFENNKSSMSDGMKDQVSSLSKKVEEFYRENSIEKNQKCKDLVDELRELTTKILAVRPFAGEIGPEQNLEISENNHGSVSDKS